jgi:hypothetical protein
MTIDEPMAVFTPVFGVGFVPIRGCFDGIYARTLRGVSSRISGDNRLLVQSFGWVRALLPCWHVLTVLPHRSAINIFLNDRFSGLSKNPLKWLLPTLRSP